MSATTHATKVVQGKAMAALIRQLEQAGWRVRRGPWPATIAAEERWDFAYYRRGLWPMNSRASQALNSPEFPTVDQPLEE